MSLLAAQELVLLSPPPQLQRSHRPFAAYIALALPALEQRALCPSACLSSMSAGTCYKSTPLLISNNKAVATHHQQTNMSATPQMVLSEAIGITQVATISRFGKHRRVFAVNKWKADWYGSRNR